MQVLGYGSLAKLLYGTLKVTLGPSLQIQNRCRAEPRDFVSVLLYTQEGAELECVKN